MKKAHIYILLALGASLLSCVKSETVTQEESANVPIFFEANTGSLAETKAIINSTDGLNKAGNKLKVYDKHTIGTSSAMYINGLEYTYGAGGWTSNPTQYWTKEGKHEFTVHNSFITDPNANTGISAPEFTHSEKDNSLSISNWTLDNKFDFLYAHATRDMASQNPYAPVQLQMKHLLCAVQFNIKDLIPKLNEHATTIEFNSIKITNFRNTATISIPFNTEPTIKLEMNPGNIQSDTQTKLLEYAKAHNIFSGQKYGDDGCLTFLPHQKENFSTVTVELKYKEKKWEKTWFGRWEQKDYPKTKTIILSKDEKAAKNWQSGNKYIYTFMIQDNNIAFEVKVVPWVVDDVILDE